MKISKKKHFCLFSLYTCLNDESLKPQYSCASFFYNTPSNYFYPFNIIIPSMTEPWRNTGMQVFWGNHSTPLVCSVISPSSLDTLLECSFPLSSKHSGGQPSVIISLLVLLKDVYKKMRVGSTEIACVGHYPGPLRLSTCSKRLIKHLHNVTPHEHQD